MRRWRRKHVADLQFGPGDLSGFTSAGMAGFHDLNPTAVVRELLQNSLDAAREVNRDTANVRFEIVKHDTGMTQLRFPASELIKQHLSRLSAARKRCRMATCRIRRSESWMPFGGAWNRANVRRFSY